jgi:DNA-binding MarR family transcriptional regulator/GNAT superfamily N-acetyltransferase
MRAVSPQITAIRRFNRFYTRLVGGLNEGLLDSSLSLAEARVLYELANLEQPTASEIASQLALDMSYLSRMLRRFTTEGWIVRRPSPADRRQSHLCLTASGKTLFKVLDSRSSKQVSDMIAPLSDTRRHELVQSMANIELLLGDNTSPKSAVILREHRPGDMGWVIERHGTLYAREYGWDQRFEALVARIVADFIDNFDPAREHCWIAERDGQRLGCVFLVRDTSARNPNKTARLRLLIVDPAARGTGLGRALVKQCTIFARDAGYQRIVLWTNSVLTAARRIYEEEGYRLVREKPHTAFGKQLVSQDWQLDL